MDAVRTSEGIGLDDHAPTWRPLVARPLTGTPVSAAEFAAAFRSHPAGVAVITADPGDGPVAMTVTSVFSVSADPPLLVFSASSTSSAVPGLLRAGSVVVHLLGAAQRNIAALCATSGVDRFADTSLWKRLDTGEPYFPSAPVWIRGRIVDRMTAGGSTVAVVQALQTNTQENSAEPLVYHNRTWHRLGEASRLPAG